MNLASLVTLLIYFTIRPNGVCYMSKTENPIHAVYVVKVVWSRGLIGSLRRFSAIRNIIEPASRS